MRLLIRSNDVGGMSNAFAICPHVLPSMYFIINTCSYLSGVSGHVTFSNIAFFPFQSCYQSAIVYGFIIMIQIDLIKIILDR